MQIQLVLSQTYVLEAVLWTMWIDDILWICKELLSTAASLWVCDLRMYIFSYCPGKTLLHLSHPWGRRSIPPMLECSWSCGSSKLGSGCQEHSNSRFQWCMVRIFGSWFHYVISTNFGRNLAGRYIISGIYLCSLFALFNSTLQFLASRQIEHAEWYRRKKMMIFLAWIQCLAV
jgi:hypothetical protein